MRPLHYVADPLCSWCYGFSSTLEQVGELFELHYVMGGLAPDSDGPMDPATRAYVQGAWDAVEAATGARFERDLWLRHEPARSTWPACRAVLAAESLEGRGQEMFHRLQQAFYLEARNPTDPAEVLDLAEELGLDLGPHLDSEPMREALAGDMAQARAWGVRGFPSLVLEGRVVMAGWEAPGPLIERLRGLLNQPPPGA